MRAIALAALLLGTGEAAAQGTRILAFRAETVDGVDELVLEDGRARIEHKEWRPIEGLDVQVQAPLPAEDVLVVVRARQGRPKVSVLEQPSAANGRRVRVRIDDGPAAGAAPVSFELWAVPSNPVPKPFDVLVITIDSLRPDRLGCYGYARPTSPNLDAFARGAVRWTRAFSSSSFTPPSHGTLLTSRPVGDHGLLAWNALPESELTLAEVLAERGYRTGASVNLTLLSDNALGQGVEWRREGDREARKVVEDALEFLREDDPRPWFLWLHLYDVHRPYGRVRGWTDLFATEPRSGIGDGEDHYNLKPEEVLERGLSPEDLRYVGDRYDAGIAYADAQLGPLLAEISTPARRARTLVVITADHGESLLDHAERRFSHDPFLLSAVTRIPLLVRYPDGRGAGLVRDDLTGLIDVAPTACAVLGLELPGSFQGRPLSPLAAEPTPLERVMYAECWGWTRQASARTREWLVVADLEAGATRAFDLLEDPGEKAALDPAADPASKDLARKLVSFVARKPMMDVPGPDPELERRLRALGYTQDDDR